MFLILDSSNLIVDISESIRYVQTQENGCIVACEKEKSDAIYSANTDQFYPLKKTGYIVDSYTMAEVFTLPQEVVAGYWYFYSGEFHTNSELQAKLTQAKAQEDMLEMVVDQEYRLTLLELGVTQDAI